MRETELQTVNFTPCPGQEIMTYASKEELMNDEGDFDALLQAFIRNPDAPRPEWAFDPNRSIDDQLNETPFFMTKLPENMEDNVKLQALQALLYDGTPEENATNFKEQGNDAFKRGRPGYQDALVFYTKGIDQRPSDPHLMAQLFNNRAAVHLALNNYGFAVRDAALSIKSDQSNVKAFWRAAKASLALEKVVEAETFCQKGLEVFPDNSALSELLQEIGSARIRIASENARLEAGKISAMKLEKALLVRGVRKHVDAEKLALMELGPGIFGSEAPKASLDPNNPKRLVFPMVLMYPPLSQFDFVEAASEDTCLLDHLTEMFAQPAPWDPEILYSSPLSMSAFILPINEALLNDDSHEKIIYRVNLRTPISHLLGSVIKCYELGLLAFYILPNSQEKSRFEHKFKDYRIIAI